MNDETLTLREAAKLCKMNHECFRRKVVAGEIPGAKIGKAWCFIKTDLLAYIRSQYVTKKVEPVTNGRPTRRSASDWDTYRSRHRIDREYRKAVGLPVDGEEKSRPHKPTRYGKRV
jgi:excisionase family DNA binding protein